MIWDLKASKATLSVSLPNVLAMGSPNNGKIRKKSMESKSKEENALISENAT